MATRNISITDRQDRFVEEAVLSGRYQNASEVVRTGLRLLEAREREDALKLERLKAAVAEADAAIAAGQFEEVAYEDIGRWLDSLGPTAAKP